ncbi:PREDICTED: ER membrane protein complex subunit 2-like [Rhagoletis zephyria]|uniref:ER membrane protein complex subunit 2-like n=1 Tax=Rhagoletis zephyria TaxID=28612 RepID=UPI0008119137|nr:PREDICTED: ER membrane protein complex subunit 2-like [Rhagoletis zephyria]
MDPSEFQSPKDFVAGLSRAEAKALLQKWREENGRNSELIREIWRCPKLALASNLGDEKWLVLEQVCLAATDLHDKTLVKECLALLQAQFPKSSRVRRLRLMANLELNERYEEALTEYNSMIAADESNSLLYKRKIAILVAAKQTTDAIKHLVDYLKKFLNDHEAWIQLAGLYIREQEYVRAAFCLEELILTSPHNHLYHEKYAEVQYTIGTPDSLELSRSYFAQAARLKPSSVRALYGLLLASNALAALPKTAPAKKKECQRLSAWAADALAKIYRSAVVDDEKHLESLEGALASLQVS